MRKTNVLLKVFASFFLIMAITLVGFAQTKEITGKIIDDGGEALPGVSIIVKGTTNGTVTNIDGNYSISGVQSSSVLVFSFIGMESQEVEVGAQTTIDITMSSQAIGLEEVVAVGYGTQRKANLTGSVDMVSADKLEARPITNVGQGLQGLVPNLNVTVFSGDPTRSTDLNIRGFESINGGSPLVLVDGVPMALDRINPQDIQSISVLKDAAAAAIYGARAAFGVILVETKKGARGTSVKLATEFGFDVPIYKADYVRNGYEYAVLRNQVHERNGDNPYYNDEYMARLKAYWDDPTGKPDYAIVDGKFENYGNNAAYEEVMNKYSPKQKYDLSISGATEKSNFYTSLSYLNTDGFMNMEGNDNFKRINVLMKGDFKINNWLELNQQITINTRVSDKPSLGSQINDVVRQEPLRSHVVPYLEDYPQYEGMYWDQPFHIYPKINNGGRENWMDVDTWIKSGIKLNIAKGLTVRSDFAYRFYNRDYEKAEPYYDLVSYTLDQPNPIVKYGNNKISVSKDNDQYYVFNAFADYELKALDNHYFKAIVGFNQEWGKYVSLDADAQVFASQSILDLGATTGTRTVDSGKSHTSLRGIFYRLNYIYKDKYLFEANGRYDGTSRFPKDSRFGFFPSFSLGWRVSEEEFMAGTSHWLDDLKVRASYGELGNQALGSRYYPYIASMNVGTADFPMTGEEAIAVIQPPGLVSPLLTWETVVSKNAGIDFTALDQRLNATFDIYTRETKDMLMRMDYPDILGTSAPDENAADLKTSGWELSLKWRDRISNDLSYDLNFSLADWKSVITKYSNPTGSLSEYRVGQQIGEIWGYETGGIIQNEEELANIFDQSRIGPEWRVGDIWYKDLDDDGVISKGDNTFDDPGDRIIIGNSNPRYSFGLNAGLNYKNWSLALFFQGVGKRDYYPSTANWTWFFPWRSYAIDRTWIEDSWTPEKPDAYWPEAQLGNKNFEPQTRYLQNVAYVRLKSATLSYNLPEKLIKKADVKSAKLYVSAFNLFEMSPVRQPLDPEYIFTGSIDYPLLRTYAIGAIINF